MDDSYKIVIGDNSVEYFVSDSAAEEDKVTVCSDCYKIFFSLSYGGRWNVEGVEYDLAPGALLLIAPFSCHHIDYENVSEYNGYTLLVSKGIISSEVMKLLEKMFGEEGSQSCFYPSEKLNIHILDMFNRFLILNDLADAERSIYFKLLVNELIVLLSANKALEVSKFDDCLGARVIKYLNNNIYKNISLDKLSRRFFVSKYHLCRAFKEYSGISVHSYINYKRIMYAKQLILSGHTASDAAEMVGFGDYSAFYRAYIKIVGKSPSAE